MWLSCESAPRATKQSLTPWCFSSAAEMQARARAGSGIPACCSKGEINTQRSVRCKSGHVAPADGAVSVINLRCYFEMFIN